MKSIQRELFGPGSIGMEASLVNLLEPGDKIVTTERADFIADAMIGEL